MLSVGFNPGELGANLAPDNEEYLKARKRRRSTVGNIWQLKAVLNEEVIDDQEFVAASIATENTSRKKSSICRVTAVCHTWFYLVFSGLFLHLYTCSSSGYQFPVHCTW